MAFTTVSQIFVTQAATIFIEEMMRYYKGIDRENGYKNAYICPTQEEHLYNLTESKKMIKFLHSIFPYTSFRSDKKSPWDSMSQIFPATAKPLAITFNSEQ